MNCLRHDVLKSLISKQKYSVITEYARITYPERSEQIIVSEYAGTDVRVYKDNGVINILCPKNMSVVQENSVVSSIENGTIFDDAETVDNGAKYIELTTLPHNAIVNKGKEPPKKIHVLLSIVVGKMDDDGRCGQSETDLTNGNNFCKDVIDYKSKNTPVSDIVDDYIGNDDHESLNVSLREDISRIEEEIDSLNGIEPEDSIGDDDWEYLDMNGENPDTDYVSKDDDDTSDDSDDNIKEPEASDDDDDTVSEDDPVDDDRLSPEAVEEFYSRLKNELNDDKPYEESFISKKPKKLKPIPRDIIAYITVEMNAIQDSNDQAMLSGYTCSKLELVDFYLNVIDTKDERYIVPHNRTYLVQMQNDLNRLLTQILRIRPVNRNDRVWQVNVNYPEGWRG